jgi:hypothetical protein
MSSYDPDEKERMKRLGRPKSTAIEHHSTPSFVIKKHDIIFHTPVQLSNHLGPVLGTKFGTRSRVLPR